MNIFVVDNDAAQSAYDLCDQHVVKMPLETAQMLSSIVQLQRTDVQDFLYKPTHTRHPCTLWVGASEANFAWTIEHGIALCEEYTRRYYRTHASERIIRLCSGIFDNGLITFANSALTKFVQAMPEPCKNECPITGYRAYYLNHKIAWARWNRGSTRPAWSYETPERQYVLR
jgi:hypothetical protein